MWQGRTYESRGALDEAGLPYRVAVSDSYRVEYLARLREHDEERRHYAAISVQYRPKRRFTLPLH